MTDLRRTRIISKSSFLWNPFNIWTFNVEESEIKSRWICQKSRRIKHFNNAKKHTWKWGPYLKQNCISEVSPAFIVVIIEMRWFFINTFFHNGMRGRGKLFLWPHSSFSHSGPDPVALSHLTPSPMTKLSEPQLSELC